MFQCSSAAVCSGYEAQLCMVRTTKTQVKDLYSKSYLCKGKIVLVSIMSTHCENWFQSKLNCKILTYINMYLLFINGSMMKS